MPAINSLESGTFMNSSSLTIITIHDRISSFEQDCFKYCPKINTVYYCGKNDISNGYNLYKDLCFKYLFRLLHIYLKK